MPAADIIQSRSSDNFLLAYDGLEYSGRLVDKRRLGKWSGRSMLSKALIAQVKVGGQKDEKSRQGKRKLAYSRDVRPSDLSFQRLARFDFEGQLRCNLILMISQADPHAETDRCCDQPNSRCSQ